MAYEYNYLSSAYPTQTLADIFPKFADVRSFYNETGLPDRFLDYEDFTFQTAYFMIMAEFASAHIKSSSIDLFKLRFCKLIFEHVPVWQREMYFQNKLLQMSDDELLAGSKAIHNHASHPGSVPSTASLEALSYIDAQTATNYVKNAPEAINEHIYAINYNPTDRLLDAFRGLFTDVLYASDTHYYVEEATANV